MARNRTLGDRNDNERCFDEEHNATSTMSNFNINPFSRYPLVTWVEEKLVNRISKEMC